MLPNGIFPSSLQCWVFQGQKWFHPFSLKSHHLLLRVAVYNDSSDYLPAGLHRGSLWENFTYRSQIYNLVFLGGFCFVCFVLFLRKDLAFLYENYVCVYVYFLVNCVSINYMEFIVRRYLK